MVKKPQRGLRRPYIESAIVVHAVPRQRNMRIKMGESVRVFPLSNWTELDVWDYIRAEAIPVASLYFAKSRSVSSDARVRYHLGLISLFQIHGNALAHLHAPKHSANAAN